MITKYPRFIAAAMIAGASFSVFTGSAEAQLTDDDPFGERDESEVIPGSDQAGVVDQAAQQLFGTGTPGEVGGASPPPSAVDPQWSDFGSMSGERVEDTYEMKMRAEINKPLPKRNPFGNRIDDIERGFKPARK